MTTEKTGRLAPSRRTLVKGAAWSVPLVVAAAPAMAACASNPADCPACLTAVATATSCKCPGSGNAFSYYLTVCFTNSCQTPVDITITKIEQGNGNELPIPGPINLGTIGPNGSACTGEMFLSGHGSPSKLRVYYSANGTPVPTFEEFDAPPNCRSLKPPRTCPSGTSETPQVDEQAAADEAKASRQGFAEIEVPNLIGQDVAEAGLSVAAAGLTLKTGAIAGRVISQTPDAGALVPRSAVVEVEVELPRGVATPEPEPVETAPADDAAPAEDAPAASEGDE